MKGLYAVKRFRLGLIINPLAGLGGSVGLKGSDNVAELAISRGAEAKAGLRMKQALTVIKPFSEQIDIVTASGDMGETLALELGFSVKCVHQISPGEVITTPLQRIPSKL